MVHSYKGGTGKTAIAINLARLIARKEGGKVLLIEQDTGGSTFTNVFKITPPSVWNDFYLSNASLKDLIVHYKHFDIICAEGKEIAIPEGESTSSFYSRHLERFRWESKWLQKNYEYIILDTRPGYSADLINSIVVSNVAILVSRLDSDEVVSTIDMYNEIYAHFKGKQIILVQNQIPEPILDSASTEQDLDVKQSATLWNDFIKDKVLISIPLKNEIAYPLSQSKILPLNNLLMDYINQIIEIIQHKT